MKRFSFIITTLLVSCALTAQELQPVRLNAPDLSRGTNIMQAFQNRASVNEVDPKDLSVQDLSDLLWAAFGINRPESGKRTAASAMNAQDIDVYVFLATGVYIYDAKESLLKPVVAGDQRSVIRGRGFVNAPVFLLIVTDISRFNRGDDTLRLGWGYMDGGLVSQNIAIFCAGTGMETRPRAGMPVDEITKLLKLTPSQHLVLNHPIGYLMK